MLRLFTARGPCLIMTLLQTNPRTTETLIIAVFKSRPFVFKP